jgi:hypothetical protein
MRPQGASEFLGAAWPGFEMVGQSQFRCRQDHSANLNAHNHLHQ